MPDNNSSLVLSTMLGFLSGLTVNYIMSILFVYKNTKKVVNPKDKKVLMVFVVLSVFGLLITELGMLLANKIIDSVLTTSNLKYVYEMSAKVVMTAVVLVYNYISRKLIIFK